MSKTQILVIGRHPAILETVLRLINQHEPWEAVGATDDEQAIELFQQRRFDLVILGGGISDEQERKFVRLFPLLQPHIKIVQHFGGGSGLLFNEIQAALEDNRAGNFQLIDAPFGK